MHYIFQILGIFWLVSCCFSHFRGFQGILLILAMSRVIFLIILDVWGILIIYEVSRFDCSFQPFQGYFCHFLGSRVILLVLEILRLFWTIKRFRGSFVLDILWFWGYFGNFGDLGSILAILGISRLFFCQKKFILLVRIPKISKIDQITL